MHPFVAFQQVLQELGTENVNLKGSQMTEILGLLKMEESIENEEKEKEKEEKQKIATADAQTADTRSGNTESGHEVISEQITTTAAGDKKESSL